MLQFQAKLLRTFRSVCFRKHSMSIETKVIINKIWLNRTTTSLACLKTKQKNKHKYTDISLSTQANSLSPFQIFSSTDMIVKKQVWSSVL